MIAHKVMEKKERAADKPPPFSKRAYYIAAAKEGNEKLDHLWIVNANAGTELEDLDLAVKEVMAAHSLNTRSKADKTYHLVVSFAAGEKPGLEALKDVERNFARALGFEDHPCVAGTHDNTDHYHIHIAYSKIHPEKLTIHEPKQDFKALARTCREMEKKYGLQPGIKQDKDPIERLLTPKARDYEATTWEASTERKILEHRERLAETFGKAKTWAQLQDLAAKEGLAFAKRGNGLALLTLKGGKGIKASTLGRNFSRKALEEKLGAFEPSRHTSPSKMSWFDRLRPSKRLPGMGPMWRQYATMRGRQAKAPSLVGTLYRNWKTFLYADALNDPLAMALIMTHRGMLDLLLGTDAQRSANRSSRAAANAVAEAPKPKASETTILVDQGTAPYRHKEGAPETYFVTIRTGDQSPATIWGKDLARAIAAGRVKPGDPISISLDQEKAAFDTSIRQAGARMRGRNIWRISKVTVRGMDRGADR
ncbi:relaxase/mobilization nuclease domain-containing protein [Rhodospirillaceae bacterium KN72]|uniref:Relaxase/mobilization nuclease domain-containing protein n=1 Tax=Pacificispira spongiicola TaxID=2729598 RepID=A0A7Y0E3K3_9PROT|nr:TraI/MobA(P) family conjugative relaxase [Pacificispira spongiicola]NMM46503.1 relaxase/mobilization nuclease domain-containing protein [Pacificispira spongiicola]